MSPKRTTPVTNCKPIIYFLQANQKNNEYFNNEDMGRHLRLRKEHVLMSSAIISQIETRNLDTEFISKVITASKKDQEWQERLTELEKVREEGKEFPKNWQSNDRLLYYKNRLYIPDNDELHTAIAKGCHDSRVPGHFGQEKTIEIVTRDFYRKRLMAWMNDYVRLCNKCQHNKCNDPIHK